MNLREQKINSSSFNTEGKPERDIYEELRSDTREDQSTDSHKDTNYQNNSSEQESSGFKSNQNSESKNGSAKRKPNLHRFLYLAGLALALFEVTRIKQLSRLYFDVEDWIKTRPFKIHDVLVNIDKKNRQLVSHIVVDDSLASQDIHISDDLKDLVDRLQKSIKNLHLSLLSLGVIGLYTSALAFQVIYLNLASFLMKC